MSRLPRWVNVVLEGGGLELEQALAQYRRLRKLVERGWVRRSVQVADACQAVSRHQERVGAAMGRARRRAAQDASAAAVRGLVEAVEQEQRRLREAVDQALPGGAGEGLSARVLALDRVVREEAWFQLAWRRFDLERLAMTAGALAWVGAVPLASWWTGSGGGYVPTLIDPRSAFEQPLAWAALLLSAVATLFAYLRAASWRWLVFTTPPVSLGLVGGLAALGGAAYLTGQVGVAVFSALFATTALSGLLLFLSLWRAPTAVGDEVDEVDEAAGGRQGALAGAPNSTASSAPMDTSTPNGMNAHQPTVVMSQVQAPK